MGIKTASIYYYYESKEMLLDEILNRFEKTYRQYFDWQISLCEDVETVDELTLILTDTKTKEKVRKKINCLVVMDFRVKVIIPETEIWYETDAGYPDYVIRKMVGAKVDYVITNVDRAGECAIASRRMALGYSRNRFFRDRFKNEVGELLTCNLLVVGPKRVILECNGFDFALSNRDLSYTAYNDLRQIYHPGQELPGKLMESDQKAGKIAIPIKEVNPNPFDGADMRHPKGCTRQATISGTYAGGVFCRLSDDTTCLCLYSPGLFSEELFISDRVLLTITRFDYEKKQIYGRILTKI